MTIKIKNFLLSIFFLFFCLIGKAFAEGEGYSLLAPIPTVTGTTQPDLVTYMKGLFTLFVGLSIVFAVLQIIIGGTQYTLAAVPSAKATAKGKMTNAVLGLFIVLISSILLNTLNPGLLRIGLNLDKVQFDAITDQVGGGNGGGGDNANQYCDFDVVSNTKVECFNSQEACDAKLNTYILTRNSHVCRIVQPVTPTPPDGEKPSGTGTFDGTGVSVKPGVSLNGVRSATINEIVNTKNLCKCSVTVTSGTDGSHNCSRSGYNHCTGYKMDIGMNPALDNYIKTNYPRAGTRGDGAPLYKAPDGAIYADESKLGSGPHWDVLVI